MDNISSQLFLKTNLDDSKIQYEVLDLCFKSLLFENDRPEYIQFSFGIKMKVSD
jgi:hypothetical protein